MKRNQFFIALSLLACTLLSCQNEKKQQSSIANKSNMEKNDTILKPFVAENLFWIREPKQYTITDSLITIVSEPHTDLWQRTYYGFSNDNAPVLQMKTSNKFFSFTVKTSFNSSALFDQCGIAIYLDSDNWMKASIEYENEEYQRLGSVVTNNGYSDWATHDIPSSIKEMWYRLSRKSERLSVVNFCKNDCRAIDNASIRGAEIIGLGTGHKLESVAKKCDTILSAVFRLCKTDSSYIDIACSEFNVFR